jgi:hypothetical protein
MPREKLPNQVSGGNLLCWKVNIPIAVSLSPAGPGMASAFNSIQNDFSTIFALAIGLFDDAAKFFLLRSR